MARDWGADVRKYDADAEQPVIDKIVRFCGIALTKRDTSLVAFKDPAELEVVHRSWLRGHLGLTDSDDVLEAGIAAVGERLKGVNFKNRVTVYYLLAQHFGKLGFLGGTAGGAGAAAATGAAAVGLAGAAIAGSGNADDTADTDHAADADHTADGGASGAGVAAAGAAGAAALGAGAAAVAASTPAESAAPVAAMSTPDVPPAAPTARPVDPVPPPQPAYRDPAPVHVSDHAGTSGGGMRWLWWLLLAAAVLALLYALTQCSGSQTGDASRRDAATPPAAATAEGTATTDANVPAATGAGATAAATATIPGGEGVTSEMRDGKPALRVYFATARTDVPAAFAGSATALAAYMTANPDARIAISGFNDPRGNPARNEALARGRAEQVQAALVATGVAADRIELVRPEANTDTNASLDEARRVEVVVR